METEKSLGDPRVNQKNNSWKLFLILEVLTSKVVSFGIKVTAKKNMAVLILYLFQELVFC